MRLSERGIMPKEQINSPATRTIEYLTDTEGGSGWAQGWHDPMQPVREGVILEPTPVVWVGWTPGVIGSDAPDGAYMQISMQVAASEVLRMADEIRARATLEAIPADELPEGVLPAIVETPPEVVTFQTISLDRAAAQKLIRATRRARDAVFGSDE